MGNSWVCQNLQLLGLRQNVDHLTVKIKHENFGVLRLTQPVKVMKQNHRRTQRQED